MRSLDVSAPVTVFDTGDELFLADGHHRVEAARRLGRMTIEANVRRGSRHDALEFAIELARDQRGLSRDEVRAALCRQAGDAWGAAPRSALWCAVDA
jgi:ParB-like chromosome segregation protein Spo0J